MLDPIAIAMKWRSLSFVQQGYIFLEIEEVKVLVLNGVTGGVSVNNKLHGDDGNGQKY
jgi:hypothetical protein